jgi:hypothetical protein
LKVQEFLFPKASACVPDYQTGRDAGSVKTDLMTKKWGAKKWTARAGVVREHPLVISSIFLSDHFFVLFFLLAWLGRR